MYLTKNSACEVHNGYFRMMTYQTEMRMHVWRVQDGAEKADSHYMHS